MKNIPRKWMVALLLFAVVATGLSAMCIVDQRETLAVYRFGSLQSLVTTPGLHFKIPLADHEFRLDNRVNLFDSGPTGKIQSSDAKTLSLRFFVLWKITNPTRLLQALGSDQQIAERIGLKITRTVETALKAQLQPHTALALLSAAVPRESLNAALVIANKDAADYGVQFNDIKITRLALNSEEAPNNTAKLSAELADQANAINQSAKTTLTEQESSSLQRAATILSHDMHTASATLAKADADAAAIEATAAAQNPQRYRAFKALQQLPRHWQTLNAKTLLEDSEILSTLNTRKSTAEVAKP